MPPLRILYVIPVAWWGGSQRYVFDMAAAARGAGHEVLVVTGEGDLPSRLKAAGIPVAVRTRLTRGIHPLLELGAFLDLLAQIRAFRPDVVHANNSKGGFIGTLAARLSGVPRIVFTAHGWAFTESRPAWQRAIFWLAHYATVLLSHRTICVSNAVRNGARGMLGTKRKLSAIHNGSIVPAFLLKEAARAALAPQLTQRVWIGTIAELHANKRIDVLIRAFERIAQTHPDVSLVVMGGGEEQAALDTLITATGLEGRVKLCGRVEDARRYLHALDLFVLPSDTEALAYALIEAGQAGLPVVASAVGGIPEVIEDGRTGLLVPRRNVDRFADAISMLLKEPERARQLGAALKQQVELEFSLEQMVAKTFALYR